MNCLLFTVSQSAFIVCVMNLIFKDNSGESYLVGKCCVSNIFIFRTDTCIILHRLPFHPQTILERMRDISVRMTITLQNKFMNLSEPSAVV